MNICRRALAGPTFLLSIAMLLLSLAGGVGVWMIKEPVTARATRVLGKVETALNIAEENLDQARVSLTRAAERLDAAREEQRKLSQQPQPSWRRRPARPGQPGIPDVGTVDTKRVCCECWGACGTQGHEAKRFAGLLFRRWR